jgi:sugar lactone lactonase YvrE
MSEYDLLLDAKATLGEGPVWDPRKRLLYWLDILEKIIHVYDPASERDKIIHAPEMVGCMALRRSGGLIVARTDGLFFFNPEANKWTFIRDPESDKPSNRFNDGKADPAGRFWAGTISLEGDNSGVAALYRVEKDLSFKKVVDKVGNSNGLAWDTDSKTMYYIDTPTLQVAAFDYDLQSGEISNRRACIHIPGEMGHPDGMSIDAEGKLWVCLWGGHCVSRWDPNDGKLLQRIELPAPNVTSCVFGGRNFDELYVTTARLALDDATLAKYPLSGGLFRVKPGVKGLPMDEFMG